jgi:hypothetical protein
LLEEDLVSKKFAIDADIITVFPAPVGATARVDWCFSNESITFFTKINCRGLKTTFPSKTFQVNKRRHNVSIGMGKN